MSITNDDFVQVFNGFMAKASNYNNAQRKSLLDSVKAACDSAFVAVGEPKPEPAPEAKAAAVPPIDTKPAAEAKPVEKPAAGAVTGAKPSSRVSQAAGGNSTISLGGDDKPASTPTGRKQYGNSNQSSIAFGASDEAKTSVKVHHAPGGQSSISLGDDSAPGQNQAQRFDRLQDTGSAPKKNPVRKMVQAAGGDSHDIFNQKPDSAPVHTSVKTHHAPGGASKLSLAHPGTPKADAAPAAAAAAPAADSKAPATAPASDAKAAEGGSDVPPAQLKAIIDAVYRKGKVKDTFTKFTQNKGKTLGTDDLLAGLNGLGIGSFSMGQATTLMQRFAADKTAMSYPEFMKMMTA